VIVLGIDPGTAVTGYGVVASDDGPPACGQIGKAPLAGRGMTQKGVTGALRLIECGVIRTSPGTPLSTRLKDIFDGVSELIARHHPDALAVEDVFYARNVRTTLVLGHARGVVLLAGERAGLFVSEYSPAVIKKTVVGRGAATKEQVQFMVARLLRLKSAPRPADAADGVACALTYVMTAGLARLRARAAG
jgi:crossover junction endodeoxyribonuclease RuvC